MVLKIKIDRASSKKIIRWLLKRRATYIRDCVNGQFSDGPAVFMQKQQPYGCMYESIFAILCSRLGPRQQELKGYKLFGDLKSKAQHVSGGYNDEMVNIIKEAGKITGVNVTFYPAGSLKVCYVDQLYNAFFGAGAFTTSPMLGTTEEIRQHLTTQGCFLLRTPVLWYVDQFTDVQDRTIDEYSYNSYDQTKKTNHPIKVKKIPNMFSEIGKNVLKLDKPKDETAAVSSMNKSFSKKTFVISKGSSHAMVVIGVGTDVIYIRDPMDPQSILEVSKTDYDLLNTTVNTKYPDAIKPTYYTTQYYLDSSKLFKG